MTIQQTKHNDTKQSDLGVPQVILLTLWVLFAFFWGIWNTPLFDLDEGAFSVASWEMLQRGDFVTTYLNGELRFDKPILIYWFQAFSVWLFGVTEWAFRLPSAIFASLWVLAVYRFASQYLDKEKALIAALLLSTSLMVVIVGRAATADALLNVLITLTLFEMYRYFDTSRSKHLYQTYIWMGFGVLCKGPVAIVIPLVISLLYALWDKRWQAWGRALFKPSAWFLFLLIVLPWYLAEYLDQGQKFIDGFFLKHNLSRFSSTMEGHGGVIWYYIPAALLIVMPYTGWLLNTLFSIRQPSWGSLDRFLWLWFGSVFVLFSLSQTQLPHYLLYGTPPLLLLMAQHHERLTSRLLVFMPPWLLFLFILAFPPLFRMISEKSHDLYVRELYAYGMPFFDGYYYLASCLSIFVVCGIYFATKIKLSYRLLIVGIVQTVFVSLVLIPVVAEIQQRPVKQAGLFLQRMEPQPTVYMQGVNMPSITIYRQHITPAPQDELKKGDWLFTRKGQLPADSEYKIHFEEGGIMLAEKL